MRKMFSALAAMTFGILAGQGLDQRAAAQDYPWKPDRPIKPRRAVGGGWLDGSDGPHRRD
jgi:hypothetical protein